jgi:predicted nucleotidyltransferase
MTNIDLLSPPNANAVASAIEAFSAAVRERYGEHLKGIYLFGSRARGDFQPFSDVDLALVIANSDPTAYEETKALTHLAYDLLLDTGVEIQPWPVPDVDWQDPARSDSAHLLRAMKRDGRPVWTAA